MFKDNKGRLFETGAHVRWVGAIPTSLLRDLPLPDRRAIQRAETLVVEGDDEFGHIELGFRDRTGGTHWIWVEPEYVEVVPS